MFSNGFSVDYRCNVNVILENSENIDLLEPTHARISVETSEKDNDFSSSCYINARVIDVFIIFSSLQPTKRSLRSGDKMIPSCLSSGLLLVCFGKSYLVTRKTDYNRPFRLLLKTVKLLQLSVKHAV